MQGPENWTSDEDVLDELRRLGITTEFANLPCLESTAFDARRREYPIRSRAPLFYVVERGSGPKTLDAALLAQSRALGVEVRFNHRLAHIEGASIPATGPRAADAIAVGYHFDTDMADGCWVICDNALAPEGYAYERPGKGQMRTITRFAGAAAALAMVAVKWKRCDSR